MLAALPADVMIVSGNLDLYRRAGCVEAGHTTCYTLRRALDAAFPLPLPLPGLNWV